LSLKPRLLILGVGGHGRSVAEAVPAAGMFEVAGFLDDAAPALLQLGCHMVLGNRLISAGFELATVVHPRAMVSPSAVIGPGSAVMAGAIVGTETRLGCGVIINCGAVVDHDTFRIAARAPLPQGDRHLVGGPPSGRWLLGFNRGEGAAPTGASQLS